MRNTSFASLFFAIYLVAAPALASPVRAASGSDDPKLTAELQKLNQSLLGLQQLMKEQLAANRLNTAIAYLNFRSRKIEVLERDLEHMKKEKDRMQGMLDELGLKSGRLAEEKRNNPNLTDQDFLAAQKELEHRRELIKKRIAEVETEILTVDIKVSELRSQIDSIERYVQDHLKQ